MKKSIPEFFRKKSTPQRASDVAPQSAIRKATFYFSSICSFMRLAEGMSPTELHNLLNTYLTAMIEVIEQYGGSVDKIMADSIMALWHQDNQAALACQCAIRQMEVLRKLNESWPADKQIELRAGINTGSVIAASKSTPIDFSAPGDAVNLAARLEHTNKSYSTSILIGQSTYDLAEAKILARELDAVKVKGKTASVLIYELIDAIADSTGVQPMQAVSKAPHKSSSGPGAMETELTVMFVDLVGFSAVSPSASPQDIVNQLNAYLEAMADLVHAHNGDIDKFIGSEIMALWQAPPKTHALDGCRCALAMVEALETMKRNWNANLRLQVGINSGKVSLGSVGGARRADFSAVGDVVNIASRLPQANRTYATQVLVGEGTHLLALRQIKDRALGEAKLGSRRGAVRVYELLEVRGPT